VDLQPQLDSFSYSTDFFNVDYCSSSAFKYIQMRTKPNQGRIKHHSAASFTCFWAHETSKRRPLSQENCCWTKGWLSPQCSLQKAPGWDAKSPWTRFRPAGRLDVLTHCGCEGKERAKERWRRGKSTTSQSDSCWDLREDKALHFSTNVRDGRCMFLTHFGVPTWFTFLGYSTSKNTPKPPSVGKHGKKKKQNTPYTFSLCLFKQGK